MNNKQVLARLEDIRREFDSRLDNVIAQLAEAEKLEKLDKLLEKPFEECYKGNCAMGIRIEGEHIEIYSCTGTSCNKEDDFCDFNIVSAERFHKALGHTIAELKQKQGD